MIRYQLTIIRFSFSFSAFCLCSHHFPSFSSTSILMSHSSSLDFLSSSSTRYKAISTSCLLVLNCNSWGRGMLDETSYGCILHLFLCSSDICQGLSQIFLCFQQILLHPFLFTFQLMLQALHQNTQVTKDDTKMFKCNFMQMSTSMSHEASESVHAFSPEFPE